MKAFADDKINVTEKLKFLLERVENIVGKGENAGYQYFLLFPQCFQKDSYTGSLKVGIVWKIIFVGNPENGDLHPKFSPFPTNFHKATFSVVKTWDCVVKSSHQVWFDVTEQVT